MSLRLFLLAVPLVVAPFVATTPRTLPTLDVHLGCKPLPPIQLQVTDSAWVGSVLELEYHVAPELDALRLETTVELPDGGELVTHVAASGRDLAADSERSGLVAVRLSDAELAAGGDVELRVAVTFAASGDDGSAGVETQTLVHRVSFGERDLGLDEVLAFDGGLAEPSLEVPAVRDDFLTREER